MATRTPTRLTADARNVPAGQVSVGQALAWLVLQALVGLAVLLQFNAFAIATGIASLLIVAIYPFMKRITFWPQTVLGLAFSWGALMGFAVLLGRLPDHSVDLVASFVGSAAPVAPLRAVDPAEITLLVGPFVPDRDSLLLKVADVGVAAQKPEELMNDRFEMQLFRREKRKAVAQIEAGLCTENRERARSSSVAARPSLLQDEPQ